jgi:hypothetical protein
MGIATENIGVGVNGTVMSFGTLTGLDTRGTAASALAVGDEDWDEGTILYAHPTVPGKLTEVRPQHDLAVAFTTVRHGSTGQIAIRIVPGNFHLEWLHDVSADNPSDGDIIQYKTSSSLWTKDSISGAGIAASVHTHPYQAAGTYVTAVNGTAPITASTDTAGVVTVGLSASYASDVHTHATSSITSGNFVATLAAGTGVTVTGEDANAAAKTVSIGQAVATNSSPTFGNGSFTGNIGFDGALYPTTSLSGPNLNFGGTNGRTWLWGGADHRASQGTTQSGCFIVKSCAGQPTTTLNGSGTTDVFADSLQNGAMALDNNAQRFYVYSSTAWRYAALTNPSDSRLKEDITEISGAVDTLRQLVPVAFKWKAKHLHDRNDSVADDGKRLGFIADQVATTDLKHWVEVMHMSGEEAEIATGSTDETEILAVNIPQNEMEALLVQALLDIDTRLKALENR